VVPNLFCIRKIKIHASNWWVWSFFILNVLDMNWKQLKLYSIGEKLNCFVSEKWLQGSSIYKLKNVWCTSENFLRSLGWEPLVQGVATTADAFVRNHLWKSHKASLKQASKKHQLQNCLNYFILTRRLANTNTVIPHYSTKWSC